MDAAKTPELPELTEENFERLTPEACRVFAFRAAVRVMPLLGGNEGGLRFWPMDDRRRNLAAVVAAIDVGILVPGYKVTTAARAADAAAARAAAAAAVYAYAATDAVRAARAAARVDAAAAAAVYAARASSVYAARASAAMQWDLQQLMQWDELKQTTKMAGPETIIPTELLFAPLWQKADGDNRQPEEWGGLIERWYSTLAEIGMEDVVQRYMDLVDGKPWDIDETERRFNAWYEEYGKEIDADKNTSDEEDGTQELNRKPDDNLQNKAEDPNVIRTASIANPNSDHSTIEDSLGREALVKALAAFLDHEDYKGQNTIGLLGHWGAGKSSVLDMLEDALSKSPVQASFKPAKSTYICATFNAWSYEHTGNIQAGMAQEVVNGLTGRLGFFQRLGLAFKFANQTEPLKFRLCFFGVVIFWLAFLVWPVGVPNEPELSQWIGKDGVFGAGLVATLFVLFNSVKTVFAHPLAAKLKTYLRLPNFGDHIGQIPVIQEQVKALCELVLIPDGEGDNFELKSNNKRFLLMIDDLDRCGEEGIVKTLEAVKLVMGLPNVTTIIAVDHRMALAALSVHYHNLAEKGSDRTAHEIARDYLGKMFTLPIQLSTPGDEDVGGYLDKVLFKDLAKSAVPEGSSVTATSNVAGSEPVQENSIESLKQSEASAQTESEKLIEREMGNDVGADIVEPHVDAADSKDDTVEVDEIVKDTRGERDHFFELSRVLEISNPRQLKRLHNSYRLLKALVFHRGETLDRLECFRLMSMLFWLEHISCLSCEERQLKEDLVLGKKKLEKDGDDEAALTDKEESILIGVVWHWFNFKYADEEKYKELKARAAPFVLPYAEVMNSTNADKLRQIKEAVKDL